MLGAQPIRHHTGKQQRQTLPDGKSAGGKTERAPANSGRQRLNERLIGWHVERHRDARNDKGADNHASPGSARQTIRGKQAKNASGRISRIRTGGATNRLITTTPTTVPTGPAARIRPVVGAPPCRWCA